MVDPSLLLSPRGLQLLAGLRLEDRRQLWMPSSFDLTLEQDEESLRRYFRSPWPIPASQLLAATEGMRRTERVWFELSDNQAEVARALRSMAPAPLIADLLEEEWVFLMTRSLILARLKKTFQAFLSAGAAALELGARRTLHLDPSLPLTSGHWGRAGAKWLAVGGAAAADLLAPLLGAPISLATGVFLLLDP